MTRINGVADGQGNVFVRYVFKETNKRLGHVVEPVRVTAHAPLLLAGYGAFEMALERSHRVPDRLKALGELKAAALAGCEFCMDIGSMISKGHGISEHQLRELHRYRESDAFDETERLVLDLAVGMTRTPVDVPDELFAKLRERFDEGQLVELAAAIAHENFRARFNWAFGLESEGFTEGAFCVPPERLEAEATNGSAAQAPA